jgi:hypothetical protein
VAVLLNELARVHLEKGDQTGAHQLLERALEIKKLVYQNRDHYSIAVTETTLGFLLLDLGREKQRAARLLSNAYRVFQMQLGPEHPHTRQLAPYFETRRSGSE